MDTNRIKSFAKEARLILMDGVLQRLKYWGFNIDGSIDQNLQSTQGGYIFRGQVFTDASVPGKWNKLKKRISKKQDIKDVVEEAAYTWFNRLIAIKILEVNEYIPHVLEFTKDIRTPVLVQNAKRGQHNLTKQSDKDLLIEYLHEDKEEQAFGLLVTELCNTNNLLHDVFGRIDDYTEILLPQNLLQKDGILELINSGTISNEEFKEVELIGWLYQFYISDKKDEVFAGFKKNQKARAEDIPAATQIFTPKWIVKYMVENTVGKIYLDYEPESSIKSDLKYLVENDADQERIPIISKIEELTLLDPACGSGHILVTGFELLFKMYREEGYPAKQAIENILHHNIFGLDIDNRAVQLARFAVLLKAAKYDSDILNRGIIPNIYCFPGDTFAESFKEEYYSKEQSDWYQLLGMKLKKQVSSNWTEIKIDEKTNKEKEVKKSVVYKDGTVLNHAIIDILQEYCEESILVDFSGELESFWGNYERGFSYSEFFYAMMILQQGRNLGSVIKLKLCSETLDYLKQKYYTWVEKAENLLLDAFEKVLWDNIKPYLEVLFILTKQYKAILANPPYLGYKFYNPRLKDYLEKEYLYTNSDLFAVFQEVISKLGGYGSMRGIINQWAWMCIDSYRNYRNFFIKDFHVNTLLHLGIGVFKELNTKKVQNVALTFTDKSKNTLVSKCFKLDETFNLIEKENIFLKRENEYDVDLNTLRTIPGIPLAFWFNKYIVAKYQDGNILDNVISPKQGLATGDNDRFVRNWYEVDLLNIGIDITNKIEAIESKKKWFPYNKGGGYNKWFGNNYYVINWYNDGFEIKSTKPKAVIRNENYYFQEGISWSLISLNFSARYTEKGFLFDVGGSSGFPSNDELLYSIALLNSKVSSYLLAGLNFTLNVQVGDIKRILLLYPDDKIKGSIDDNANELIRISKLDFNYSELSRNFQNHILLDGVHMKDLRDAFSYTSNKIEELIIEFYRKENFINKEIIDLYRLTEEITPNPDIEYLTVFRDFYQIREIENEKIKGEINRVELISSLLNYFIGIHFGRFRMDKPGLNIAHPNPTEEEIASYQYNGHTIEIDEDGILPIMGENCAFPDDALVLIKDLIQAIWGEETLTDNINFLHECLGLDLNKWLTEKFWGYHTSMYKKKPIYWMFSSNAKKPQNAAFKVLVYMHRMDKYTVQKIQRNYLHPHQEFIKREVMKLLENEESLSKQEQKHLEQYQNWELECRDYNEVLKSVALESQKEFFDLDDGVDVNYAKFEEVVAII